MESSSKEMNNDNDLNLHSMTKLSGWLRYCVRHKLEFFKQPKIFQAERICHQRKRRSSAIFVTRLPCLQTLHFKMYKSVFNFCLSL